MERWETEGNTYVDPDGGGVVDDQAPGREGCRVVGNGLAEDEYESDDGITFAKSVLTIQSQSQRHHFLPNGHKGC
jgi:hypothetical protein